MTKLALLGGPQTVALDMEAYVSIGSEEIEAAKRVVGSGVLSRYLGCWGPDFFGGNEVQSFEQAWADHFRTAHAISVNSCTSGLMAAVGAAGVEPGDEVIVSPWTMSASATSILVWNAIPVFADIEDETFNLDPASVERNLTPRTKAIVVSDIFGHPADLDALMAIARKHDLVVIEDTAQSPGAMYKGRFAGTVGHIGVFSLNYHKHIHTGEGGVCVTDASRLAERMQLIRNHAESVVEDKGVEDLGNMIGFNFRMNELEAAIGIAQLSKLDRLLAERIAAADRLSAGLRGLPGLRLPVVKPDCTHVYYVYPLLVDPGVTGVQSQRIAEALRAEGVKCASRYCNLHMLPMYQKKIAFGTKGYPWSAPFYQGGVSYEKGICPVAEGLQDQRYLGLGMCFYRYAPEHIDLVIRAFHKVWDNMDSLTEWREG